MARFVSLFIVLCFVFGVLGAPSTSFLGFRTPSSASDTLVQVFSTGTTRVLADTDFYVVTSSGSTVFYQSSSRTISKINLLIALPNSAPVVVVPDYTVNCFVATGGFLYVAWGPNLQKYSLGGVLQQTITTSLSSVDSDSHCSVTNNYFYFTHDNDIHRISLTVGASEEILFLGQTLNIGSWDAKDGVLIYLQDISLVFPVYQTDSNGENKKLLKANVGSTGRVALTPGGFAFQNKSGIYLASAPLYALNLLLADSEFDEQLRVMTTVPKPPQVFAASGSTGDSITLTWSPVNEATGYEVSSLKLGGSNTKFWPTTATSLTIGGLNPSTQYDFKVRSQFGTTFSANSTMKSFSTL